MSWTWILDTFFFLDHFSIQIAIDERSSSDDDNENCNKLLIATDDNDEPDVTATTCFYDRHFEMDNSSDSEDADSTDSDESDEYSSVAAEHRSESDEKCSIDLNISTSNSSLFESNSSLCESNSSFANPAVR